tara:strand:- start:1394 stop:2746 length:1353 start_codon:yes stop_codon:yes gene_type:complete
MGSIIKFINHACVCIETKKSLLVTDPWLEGKVFNNGWSLLDDSTSNEKLLNELKTKNKKIFIWYSHEHPDHLSFSFLKLLKDYNLDCHIFYQKNFDRRVVNAFKKLDFSFSTHEDGEDFLIDSEIKCRIYKFNNIDSYLYVDLKNHTLLFLNDCLVNNKKQALKVKEGNKRGNNYPLILFTQFGYASKVGNISDKAKRLISAEEKLDRIIIQAETLATKAIIPYASFCYFCSNANYYMNYEQNSAQKVFEKIKNQSKNIPLAFLKPNDQIELEDNISSLDKLFSKSKPALHFWSKLYSDVQNNNYQIIYSESVDINEIIKSGSFHFSHLNKINFNLPYLFSFIKLIKPIIIYLTDIDKCLYISFNKIFEINSTRNVNYDVLMRSYDAKFLVSNLYGYDTNNVNACYQVFSEKSSKKYDKFFAVQRLTQRGISLSKPLTLISYVYYKVFGN